jgi:hypothetical protein
MTWRLPRSIVRSKMTKAGRRNSMHHVLSRKPRITARNLKNLVTPTTRKMYQDDVVEQVNLYGKTAGDLDRAYQNNVTDIWLVTM